MPVIPEYDSKEALDTNARGMPRPDYSNADITATAGMGKAIAGLGSAISEVAQHRAQREAQVEALSTRTNEGRMLEQIAADDAEALQKMPETGAGFHDERVANFKKRTEAFMTTVPPPLQEEYRNRLALAQDKYSNSVAATEAKQTATFAAGQLDQFSNSAKTAIANNPGELDGQLREADERIAMAPGIPASLKPEMARQMKEQLKVVALTKIAGGDPNAMAALVGMKYEPPERASRGPLTRAAPGLSGTTGALQANGLPKLAAAALAGHIASEGGTNPNSRNPGDGADGSDSIGIVQWNSDRATNLKKFAAEQGKPWNDRDVQLAFVVHELKTRERGTYDKLIAAKTIDEASAIAAGYFRPAGWSAANPTASHNYGYRAAQGRAAFAGTNNATSEAGQAIETAAPGSSVGSVVADAKVKGDPRFADMSFETKQKLIQAAAVQQSKNLAVQDAQARVAQVQAEVERKTKIDNLQYSASKGQVTLPEIDMMWKDGQFRSYEEYSSVKTLIEKAATDDSAYTRGVDKLMQPRPVWDPLSKEDKDSLAAIDEKTGTLDRLRAADPKGAQEVAVRFADTGMVSQAAKGAFEGMIRAGSPQQLEYAMSALDQMYRRNSNAFMEAFGKDTFGTLQQWQSQVDRNPAAFREELKAANDPAHLKAREELVKQGRKLATDMTDAQMLHAFDGNSLPFLGDPAAPITTDRYPGMGIFREEFSAALAEGMSKTGDPAKAQEYAVKTLKPIWADSDLAGGRFTKYAPEVVLPAIKGDHSWAKKQIDEAVLARGGKSPGNVRLPTPGAFNVAPTRPEYALVADEATKAEVDAMRSGLSLPGGRESPSWALVIVDPDTGAKQYKGRFFFNPQPTRADERVRLKAGEVEMQQFTDAGDRLKAMTPAERMAQGLRHLAPTK